MFKRIAIATVAASIALALAPALPAQADQMTTTLDYSCDEDAVRERTLVTEDPTHENPQPEVLSVTYGDAIRPMSNSERVALDCPEVPYVKLFENYAHLERIYARLDYANELLGNRVGRLVGVSQARAAVITKLHRKIAKKNATIRRLRAQLAAAQH